MEDQPESFSIGEKVFVSLFSLALFATVILLTVTTASPFPRILLSFSPAILVIITVITMFLKSRNQFRIVSWILPIFWPAVFYMVVFSGLGSSMRDMEVGGILAFNFMISFIFVLVMEIMVSVRQGFTGIFAKVKVSVPKNPKPEDISASIALLGEKAKVINQSIGKVYRRSNGATLRMRDMIKISPALYNSLRGISHEVISKDADSALKVLWGITEKLNTLYMPEESVFGEDCYRLKNLARDPAGRTRVIDVIISNDPEPVALAFKAALESCKKAIEEIEILKEK